MSGYDGFSKSNNAVSAEACGRYPASRTARKLALPVGFIREKCQFASGGEFHHTSKFYNSTHYYDVEEIQSWVDSDPDLTEEHGVFAEVLAAWKAAAAGAKPVVKVYRDAEVRWLEWGGTRNHPKAIEREGRGTVEDAGGKFVTVTLASGVTFRKGKDTNGFEVLVGGKRVWFS